MRVPYDKVKDVLDKKLSPPPTFGDGPPIAPEMLLSNLVTLQQQCDQALRDRQAAEEQKKCVEDALANVIELLSQCVCGKRRIHEGLELGTSLSVPPSHLSRRASSSVLRSVARRGVHGY